MFHEVSKGLEAYPRTWPFFGSFKKINKAFFYHFFKTGNLDPNSTKCLGLKLYPKHCILHSGCSLSCSAGCWRTDTSRDSTDCHRPDPSRCSTGCYRQDISRDSTQSFVTCTGATQAAVEHTHPGAAQSAVEQKSPGAAQTAVDQTHPGAA
jgi:hypothetical protein